DLPSSDIEGTVLIYDTSGRLIFSRVASAGSSDRICYWPADESIPSGVYTAVYLSGQSVSSVRLVLIR
ncbi:MAG: T9SS type A sorting domain-containing protein, partial [Candidatus Aegiribacteria sp.]|nr:T9SS type A sorting domain-containing protein [Candidatus Aegiribacteria sp.]